MKHMLEKYLLKYKRNIYEAFAIDSKTNEITLNFNKFINIIENIKETTKEENNQNHVVIYNGNPYKTLELAVLALINNNNVIFIINNEMLQVNTTIINMINEIIKENNFTNVLKLYNNVNLDKMLSKENVIDTIYYFGDKFKYRKLKKKTNIPIVYNGFGSILIYTDNEEEFEEKIDEIREYAFKNNISINIFYDNMLEEIQRMNKDGKNDICIIFSNDQNIIEQFKKEIDSKKIYINEFKEET